MTAPTHPTSTNRSTTMHNRDWQNLAACKTNPDRMFPPDETAEIAAAKTVCRACPVQTDCLTWALDTREEHGVWGGLTHTERRHHLRGTPIQPCSTCGHPFVPELGHQHRCNACNAPKNRHPAILEEHRPQITAWVVEQHLSDPQIAANLKTHTKHVYNARKRWGLPSGVTLRPQPEPTPAKPPTDKVRPGTIDAVLAGTMPFRHLNLAERAQLWLHHQAAGDSAHRFSLRYRVSWRIVRQIRAAAEAQQQQADRELVAA